MKTKTNNPVKILTITELVNFLNEHLPLANKDDDEHYGDLLEDLFHFSLNTHDKLLNLFKRRRNLILQYEKEMATGHKIASHPIKPIASETFEDKLRLARGVYFTHTGLVRLALEEELGEPWQKYIRSPEWTAREIEWEEHQL